MDRNQTDIEIAAAYLRAGEVVAIPTETVYGLAGNALSASSVARIFEVKKRPFFDPLIVHIAGSNYLQQYTTNIHPTLIDIATKYMPGPITILSPKKSIIPDLVTSGLEQVALRVPSHPTTLALLRLLDFPLAAPSANPFGYISPTNARHVSDQLGSEIPYILDGGPCEVGIESTIIGMEEDTLIVYRKGGLPISELFQFTKKIKVNETSSSKPNAPGMLASHYAPSIPMSIVDDWSSIEQDDRASIGVITFGDYDYDLNGYYVANLSKRGDTYEAAQNLFAIMRQMDQAGLKRIYCRLLPEEGLGIAINDRLRRAAV